MRRARADILRAIDGAFIEHADAAHERRPTADAADTPMPDYTIATMISLIHDAYVRNDPYARRTDETERRRRR